MSWIAILDYREPGVTIKEVPNGMNSEELEELVHNEFSKDTDWMGMEKLNVTITNEC